jgi:pimeloyl-ACP methyl ester carboxylesterase
MAIIQWIEHLAENIKKFIVCGLPRDPGAVGFILLFPVDIPQLKKRVPVMKGLPQFLEIDFRVTEFVWHKNHFAGSLQKRGFDLTADNLKTENLAVPVMAPLYEKITKTGGRLGALSACLLGSFPSMDSSEFKNVDIPVLVIAGSRDTVSGSPLPLAEAIPHARAVVAPDKTHLSVINSEFFFGAVLGFLGHVWQDDPRHSWIDE